MTGAEIKETPKRYNTFAILYFINKSKMKKNGLCSIVGRISINTELAEFNTQLNVAPDSWDAKQHRVTSKCVESAEINQKLDEFTERIITIYNETIESQAYITAKLVKNTLNGIGQKSDMLLKLFAEHNDEYKLCVGVNRTKQSYKQYLIVYKHVSEFVKHEYNVVDVLMRQLSGLFIEQLDLYLRTAKKLSSNSIANYMILFKKIIRRAMNQGTLSRDPFFAYTPRQSEKILRHMTTEELDKFMIQPIGSKPLCHTRDMFVFSCFTGLAYIDLRNLSEENICVEKNGSMWIHTKRQKTGGECHIRLLEIPRRIIEKYRSERKSNKVFNTIAISNIENNLKKIKMLCGIERHITFHMSRHNFATLITLSQGVSIETVSRMMGHLDIKSTQLYSKLIDQKVNEDMKALMEKTTNQYKMFDDNK